MRQKSIAAIALVCLFAIGCTSALDRAKQTVTVAEKVWSVGWDELRSLDQATKDALQAQFDAGTLTAEQAEAKFNAWIAKRTKAVLALNELKHAFTLAGLGIEAYEAGKTKDLTAVMVDAAKAFTEALAALADAGVHMPGWN